MNHQIHSGLGRTPTRQWIQRSATKIAAFFFLAVVPFGADRMLMAQQPWQPPVIEHCISIRDGRTGERLSLDKLLGILSGADVVFLGETHDDDTTHRFESAVFDGMLTRRPSKVVLAMEMFECDVQPQLDEYLAGKIDEATFLSKSRPWGNYREAYRPLIEKAKAAGRTGCRIQFSTALADENDARGRKSDRGARRKPELGTARILAEFGDLLEADG